MPWTKPGIGKLWDVVPIPGKVCSRDLIGWCKILLLGYICSTENENDIWIVLRYGRIKSSTKSLLFKQSYVCSESWTTDILIKDDDIFTFSFLWYLCNKLWYHHHDTWAKWPSVFSCICFGDDIMIMKGWYCVWSSWNLFLKFIWMNLLASILQNYV